MVMASRKTEARQIDSSGRFTCEIEHSQLTNSWDRLPLASADNHRLRDRVIGYAQWDLRRTPGEG
jgi:hypothetical protein